MNIFKVNYSLNVDKALEKSYCSNSLEMSVLI